MITLQYNDSGTIERLQGLRAQAVNPRAMMAAVGREGANQLRRHFRQRDKTPNKLGGKRQHFWLQVMRSVQVPVVEADGRAVTLSINHPAFAQKVFGGTIRAQRAGALTIPVDPEAYGRTAAVFERETGLQLIFIKSTNRALLCTRAQGSDTLQVRYLLTPSVEQPGDPDALPAMGEGSGFQAAILARAQAVVDRQLAS